MIVEKNGGDTTDDDSTMNTVGEECFLKVGGWFWRMFYQWQVVFRSSVVAGSSLYDALKSGWMGLVIGVITGSLRIDTRTVAVRSGASAVGTFGAAFLGGVLGLTILSQTAVVGLVVGSVCGLLVIDAAAGDGTMGTLLGSLLGGAFGIMVLSQAVSSFLQDDIVVGKRGIEKVIQQLVREMRDKNVGTVAQAMGKLSDELLLQDDDLGGIVSKIILLLDGHELVVAAMKKWKKRESIHTSGFGILAQLVYTREKKEVLLKAGIVDVSASALRRFTNSSSIQTLGFFTILSLLSNDGAEKNDGHGMKHFLHDLRGASLIVNAMKRFSRDADMQWIGCHMIFAVVSRAGPLYKNVFLEAGAQTAIAATTENHPGNPKVLEKADQVMKVLTESSHC
jgi:hypothetical protein